MEMTPIGLVVVPSILGGHEELFEQQAMLRVGEVYYAQLCLVRGVCYILGRASCNSQSERE